jgi:hypothetical protein
VAIAFVVQRYGTEVAGGAEALCRDTARALVRAGEEVTIYTTTARDYLTWAPYYPEGTTDDDGVEVRRFAVNRPDPDRSAALVRRLADDGHAARLQDLLQRVGDLRRQLLLDLQAMGIGIDHTGELADADHALVRQVADMNPADDRHHVMLAVRLEPDVAQRHDFVVALDLLEGPLQHVARILVIAREELLVGAHDTVGGAGQALTTGIIAGPADQRADGGLGLLARGPGQAGGERNDLARLRHLVHRLTPLIRAA